MRVRCPHCHNPIELVADEILTEIECPSCGSHFELLGDHSTASTVSYHKIRRLAHFELLEQIGTGAHGSVWKARDTKLDRTVAVKIPRAGQLDKAEIEQFFREARAAAQVRHPNIVSVHEVGREDSTVYIVSEFIQGANLKDSLGVRQLTAHESAELCANIADALHEAHEAGVVHRDLKPGNIMIDTSGNPHIADFGLAKRETGEITMTVEGKILGTPAYMPPEQASGKAHDADRRSDVYSLGVILYELLTGELPFRGTRQMLISQIMNDEPAPLRKLNSQIPVELEIICLKCLEKEPDKRLQKASDVADELRRFMRGEPIVSRPISTLGRVLRWYRKRPGIAISFAFIGIGALILVSWLGTLVAERIIKESINGKLQLAVTDRRAMVQAYVAQQHERVGLVASGTQFRRLIQGYYDGEDLMQMREDTRRIWNDACRVTKDFVGIRFATPEGKVITATRDELLDADSSNEHDFRQGLSRNHLGVPTSTNGHYHAQLCAPAVLHGETLGVVMIELNVDYLCSILAHTEGLGGTGVVLVAKSMDDGNVEYLFPPSGNSEFTAAAPASLPLIIGDSRDERPEFREADYGNKRVLACSQLLDYQPGSLQPWTLVAMVDRRQAYQPLAKLRRVLLVITGTVILAYGVTCVIIMAREHGR